MKNNGSGLSKYELLLPPHINNYSKDVFERYPEPNTILKMR